MGREGKGSEGRGKQGAYHAHEEGSLELIGSDDGLGLEAHAQVVNLFLLLLEDGSDALLRRAVKGEDKEERMGCRKRCQTEHRRVWAARLHVAREGN